MARNQKNDGKKNDDGRDDKAKRLLTSTLPSDREEGMALLDSEYRGDVCGYIRTWSRLKRIPFSSTDLADTWYETRQSVRQNVDDRKFRHDGQLPAYLKKIAHRRACDLLGKRLKILAASLAPTYTTSDPHAFKELVEEIERFYVTRKRKTKKDSPENLPDEDILVLEVEMMFYYQIEEWPPLEELTFEVNRRLREIRKQSPEFSKLLSTKLAPSTVRGRRYRIRAELGEHLEKRGYGGYRCA